MHRKFGLLSLGKACSHSTALPTLFVFFQCAVFSCFHTKIWMRAIHTNGGQAQTNLHKTRLRLRVIEKLFLTLPCQGIEPIVFEFEFRLSNH